MPVLILGDPSDPHVATVAAIIAKAGGTPVVFHRFSLNHQLSLEFERGTFSAEFKTEAGTFRHKDFQSVWSRVKPISGVTGADPEENMGQEFAAKEWAYVIQSLPMLLSQATWVNEPHAQQRISTKPYQLMLAQQVGFTIPLTRITNNPTKTLELFDLKSDILYKTVSNFIFPPDNYIFTTRIARSEVVGREYAIQRAPGIFQEYIHKAYELRVTVVHKQVFATRINSQRSDSTMTDWRRSQLEEGLYEPVTFGSFR